LFGRALVRLTIGRSHRRRAASGQSIVEFAMVLPVILFLLVSIADLGRLYTSAVAIESAAREAADFGAFDASYWDATLPPGTNVQTTVNEMRRRACTAAAGSHLQDYETTDPVDHTTCTNPTFACELEWSGSAADCESSSGFVNTSNCSDDLLEPPCTVHVTMTYDFRPILAIPPFPASIEIARHSRFRISNLTPPPAP
jgi:Flp pilus assembly protein TadG